VPAGHTRESASSAGVAPSAPPHPLSSTGLHPFPFVERSVASPPISQRGSHDQERGAHGRARLAHTAAQEGAPGRANRPPERRIELQGARIELWSSESSSGRREGGGARGPGAEPAVEAAMEELKVRAGRTSAHARRREARPPIRHEVPWIRRAELSRRQSTRGGGGGCRAEAARVQHGFGHGRRRGSGRWHVWGTTNHRMGAPFSTRGTRGRGRRVGGVNSVRGWDWGSVGVHFFALNPYFLSRGSSREAAVVALTLGSLRTPLAGATPRVRQGNLSLVAGHEPRCSVRSCPSPVRLAFPRTIRIHRMFRSFGAYYATFFFFFLALLRKEFHKYAPSGKI
jgi:hypothetical protein